jgi:hypothetical protein
MKANEFLDKLNKDEVQAGVVLVGMVKKNEEDPDSLLFAIGQSCENWIAIPSSLIAEIDELGNVPCKDHIHPYVRLTLKVAQNNDTKALVALLAASSRQRERTTRLTASHSAQPSFQRSTFTSSLGLPTTQSLFGAINRRSRQFHPYRIEQLADCNCAYYGCGSCDNPICGDGCEVVCYCGSDPNPHTRCDCCC